MCYNFFAVAESSNKPPISVSQGQIGEIKKRAVARKSTGGGGERPTPTPCTDTWEAPWLKQQVKKEISNGGGYIQQSKGKTLNQLYLVNTRYNVNIVFVRGHLISSHAISRHNYLV